MPAAIPVAPVEPARVERDYRIAGLADLGIPIEPGRFYDASYRPALSAMVAHVLAVEAPDYEELLVRRVAHAHGLQRVGHLVREAIVAQIDASVTRTDDDGRPVLWPPGEEPRVSYPHRAADPGVRGHADTPMAELVGLAGTLQANASEADGTEARAVPHRSFRAGAV